MKTLGEIHDDNAEKIAKKVGGKLNTTSHFQKVMWACPGAFSGIYYSLKFGKRKYRFYLDSSVTFGKKQICGPESSVNHIINAICDHYNNLERA